ncbi:MAG: cyclin-dependent kinase inhibitor 3 family protein [Pseudomonadota bacterium]
MTRTSDTHPLRIDAVTVPGHTGLIGLTFCPGKKQKTAMTGSWDRDLEKDLAAIRSWGGSALISLIEAHEYVELEVTELPHACLRYGMAWYGLPIVDGAIPDALWEEKWTKSRSSLHQTLREGGRIVIHCKGGLGRTGLLAARILVEFGLPPYEAIERVRQARPGAIETTQQESYVRDGQHQRPGQP